MQRVPTLLLLATLLLAPMARADEAADVQRLMDAGEHTAALQRADKALVLKPRDAQLRFMRGVLLAEMKRDEEALALFQRLNEDFPELPDPLNNIGVLHAAQGRLELSRVALEAALRNDPQHRSARENLADVYVRLAVRLWDGLASDTAADAGLARKLRLARELLRPPG
jgi:Flp pilus assembly protein TadD